MLNYTTTTFINSGNFNYCDGRYVKDAAGNNLKDYGSGANEPKYLQVKFGPKITNDGIIHKACLVGLKAYTAANNATARIMSLPSDDNIYRIGMYIRLRNSNNPTLSNDWTFKGKPIYVEFKGGESETDIINRVDKYMLAQYGYNLVEFTTDNYTSDEAVAYNATLEGAVAEGDDDGNSGTYSAAQAATYNASLTGAVSTSDDLLVINACDQWEIFMDQDGGKGVWIEKLDTNNNFVKDNSITITVNNGNEAFGDFAHIMKDLRLPTRENTNWFGTTVAAGENDDVPSVTGHYTQYTIQLTSERGVLQQSAVGGVGVSRTVHVFYVESAATTNFEAALYAAGITTAATAAATTTPDSTIADTRNTGGTATV